MKNYDYLDPKMLQDWNNKSEKELLEDCKLILENKSNAEYYAIAAIVQRMEYNEIRKDLLLNPKAKLEELLEASEDLVQFYGQHEGLCDEITPNGYCLKHLRSSAKRQKRVVEAVKAVKGKCSFYDYKLAEFEEIFISKDKE